MSKTTSNSSNGLIKELMQRGAHLGFSRSRQHSSTLSYIFGFKNRQAIIDLEQTSEDLNKAKNFVRELGAKNKNLLLVGAKNEARHIISTEGKLAGMPFVAERWLGGTLTNFKEMRRRVNRLLKIQEQEQAGELMVYTKKERAVIGKEKEKLERYFASLTNLTEMPGAMLIVDPNQEKIALAEALKVGVPVVAIANSDCDVRSIAYPIIANDSAQASIEFLVKELTGAYNEGKKSAL